MSTEKILDYIRENRESVSVTDLKRKFGVTTRQLATLQDGVIKIGVFNGTDLITTVHDYRDK